MRTNLCHPRLGLAQVRVLLGVRPAKQYLYYVIMSPVGPYYPGGLAPTQIKVIDNYVRAVAGGLGEAKTSANYAASLYAAEK